MANQDNTSLGPPPLATPITGQTPDEFGIPFQLRGAVPTGGLHTGWSAWFTALYNRLQAAPLVQAYTLTTASTTIDAPTTAASELVVVLIQDATGGRAVVWGSGFSYSSKEIDTTANTVSVFRFVRATIGGAQTWVMVGQPTTGMV